MSKRVLGSMIVDNSMLEYAKQRISEEGLLILDIHPSSYEELASNPVYTCSLARYGTDHEVYSTIIVERLLNDETAKRMLDTMLAFLKFH